MEYKEREKLYYNQLQILFDRWTREIEKAVWSGHIESERAKIDLCFNLCNDKAMEIYSMDSVIEDEEEKIPEPKSTDKGWDPFTKEEFEKSLSWSEHTTAQPHPETPKTIPIPHACVHFTSPVPQFDPVPDFSKKLDKSTDKDLGPLTKNIIPETPKTIPIDKDLPKTKGSLPIVELSFSPNVHNCLHVANIKTLDELLSLNQTQIEHLLDFNEKNILELILDMDKLNIKHNFKLSKFILQEILPNSKVAKAKAAPIKKFTKISGFDFNNRVHGRLAHAGIETLEQLLSKTTKELLSIRQFGPTLLEVIMDELDHLDIKHSFKIP